MAAPAPVRLLAVLLAVCRWGLCAGNCHGGQEAACACLLHCSVFGADAQHCHEGANPDKVVDDVVQRALTDPGSECDGIGCVVACSKQLGCLDDAIKAKCESVKQEYPKCHANCNFGRRGAAPSGGALLAALAAAGLLAARPVGLMGSR
mmetsp:Transcript_30146/g.86321  ORF Transcript_30146/g.86321 Transcript_30146/m.86321 type:complete len:149 (+) Transcript_30146:83-529(+)